MFRKARYIVSLLVLLVVLYSCTSSKNTASTRWYHSFNTRYNVYFNGKLAYDEALKNQIENYEENFTETILLFPVSALPKDKENAGGPFDRAIEKSVKAIKQHSIQTKPERKAGKRNDPKYKEFMSRTEYNPFLYNSWLMMAKSQFHNGDFLLAASSFSYISRLYGSQPEIASEAKIWHARSYAELEWYYEAEDMLAKIDTAVLSKNKNIRNLWDTAQADLLIKQKNYEQAIPFLKSTIKTEKNKVQKEREKYLLGQLYSDIGQDQLAYQAYGKVSSANAPYILEFNAKIRQTEVYAGTNPERSLKQLRKMTKGSKNKEYQDQVYYAMGNVYMSIPDTAKAIESYETGVAESTRKGMDMGLNQIKLGDLYFELKDYVNAQPNYSSALGFLKKGDRDYARVSKRSEVLDELVIFHEAVILQDSLLRLSDMTEEEQLAIIDGIIEELIKKEEEEQKEAERAEFLAEREAQQMQNRPTPLGMAPGIVNPADVGAFYFYSAQSVARGKGDFQQRWGRRVLEDDWRRRDKSNFLSGNESLEEEAIEEDILPEVPEGDLAEVPEGETAPTEGGEGGTSEEAPLSDDPKDPQFYLQQIPKTEEEKEAAHLIIADGLFNMGVIYKDKLEDPNLALETFVELEELYPETEHLLEAYYNTYMIYLKEENRAMSDFYKGKIRESFPESDYAIAMEDPDYEYNLKMMYVLQDSLYRDTYDSYLESEVETVRSNYDLVTQKYPQSKLMPQFMFLNALSYVQTGESDQFKESLKSLMEKYPEADVSILASEMMKRFQRGLELSGNAMLARGGIFNLRFGGLEDMAVDTAVMNFSPEINGPHQLLLVYPKGLLNDNLLLFTVASYNFGNFQVNDFDLEQVAFDEISMLQIKPFANQGEVLQYIEMIEQPNGYVKELGPDVIILPISIHNYDILMKGRNLGEYMTFFEEEFGKENRTLIERWRIAEDNEGNEDNEDNEGNESNEGNEDNEGNESNESNEGNEIEEIIEIEVEEVDSIAPELPLEELEVIDIDTIGVDSIVIPIPTISIDSLGVPVVPLIAVDSLEVEVVKVDSIASPVPVEEAVETEEKDETMTPDEEDPWADSEEVGGKSNALLNKLTKLIEEKTGVDVEALFEEEEVVEEETKKSTNPIEEYVKMQEEADREQQKITKEQQKIAEKEAKALKKQQEKEAKALKRLQEKEKKAIEKAKEEDRKRKAKEKEELRKQREKEREEAQKLKEAERKAREKAREEERKQKAKAREELQKQRDAERKAAAKAKEEARKQKERERKEAQKLKEQERKQKK